jgi:hypothetical protein
MKAKVQPLMRLPVDEIIDIRFLPNHRKPSESIHTEEKCVDPSGDECTREEYWLWKKLGESTVQWQQRHYCNALVNGQPVILIFGRSLKKVIDACLSGSGEIDNGEALIATEPINLFDIKSDASIHLKLENVPGFPFKRMKTLGIMRDPKNILWREGEDKANIMAFFKLNFGELNAAVNSPT